MKNKIIAQHIIAEFFYSINLENINSIKKQMIIASEIANCKILDTNFHQFGSTNGVTGVVLLKESHMSIHTWPEYSYAAIDIFVCGNTFPNKAIESLKLFFKPKEFKIKNLKRGV
jgi:S-adenosylmethionine decarboxylase